jgi:hypothetical protein
MPRGEQPLLAAPGYKIMGQFIRTINGIPGLDTTIFMKKSTLKRQIRLPASLILLTAREPNTTKERLIFRFAAEITNSALCSFRLNPTR